MEVPGKRQLGEILGSVEPLMSSIIGRPGFADITKGLTLLAWLLARLLQKSAPNNLNDTCKNSCILIRAIDLL